MSAANPLTDRFEPFGREVICLVEAEFRAHKSLLPLCERFGLHATAALSDQTEKLQAFIYKNGISFFLECVERNLSGRDVDQLRMLRMQRNSARDRSAKTGGAAQPGSPPSQPSPAPEPPRSVSKPLAPRLLGPASSPAQPKMDEGPPFAGGVEVPTKQKGVKLWRYSASGRVWVCCAAYTGWCRRSGKDRRKGPRDRREGAELIYKNRRFGPDRRKTIRRHKDRE